jgi:hypothetical protein
MQYFAHHPGSEGAKLLAEAIRGNSSLIILDVHGNSMLDESATEIAGAIRNHKNIQQLWWMYRNQINVDGAREIAELLKLDHFYKNISYEEESEED